MQAVSGRTRESGKRPRLTSGLRGARCWGRTVSIDSEVRTLDHLNDLRHSHPSAIPTLPPFPSFRHSHPSAIPILPPFLRPLRHSCGGRNPCDRPTVRRASIRHSHPSAIPAPPPSFLRRQESMRPPNRATSLHPPFPSFRHSCAPSVIPAEAGIHATAQPCDEPPSARRPTRAPSAPRVIGRRRTLGVPLTPQIAWIPASAGMTDRRV